jgi:hypothetical protein
MAFGASASSPPAASAAMPAAVEAQDGAGKRLSMVGSGLRAGRSLGYFALTSRQRHQRAGHGRDQTFDAVAFREALPSHTVSVRPAEKLLDDPS